MLLPLALLATTGVVDPLPDRAKRAVKWFSTGLFGLAASALWLGWIAMVSGFPLSLARELYRLQPDYTPLFDGFLLTVACLYTALWLFVTAGSSQFNRAYLITWTAGIILTWGLLMTLWLPWFESGSSYRIMFASLKEKIPACCRSVRAWGLGESERALLEYYTGVIPRKDVQGGVQGCDLVLVQSGSTRVETSLGPGWKVIWEQSRPTKPEKRPKEIFTLLQRGE
jgi:4-amino-4-deoxy-L-arabinose transferase-like glycosyltransferase